ncbi:HAD family hydrolase [Halobellus sp. Atlit-31R]|nr:HAD family hydrolase [Halobellus sp. Atlit-31R]
MAYDAIIFDNDGVLTRPTPTTVHREAVRAAFAEFDVEPTTEAVDAVIHGGLSRIRSVCSLFDLDHETFWPRHEANAAAAQRAAIERGEKTLYEDVDALYDVDRPLAVVSNNQHETIEAIVDHWELGELFTLATGREPSVEGFRRRKPSAHYLESAIDEIGGDSVLYVGDSNVDIVAANRAGVDSAFVRRPHRSEYELVADPTYEVASLDAIAALA